MILLLSRYRDYYCNPQQLNYWQRAKCSCVEELKRTISNTGYKIWCFEHFQGCYQNGNKY